LRIANDHSIYARKRYRHLGNERFRRTTGREKGAVPRYDVLGQYAQLAAEGRFTIPIARTFALEDWREAAELSMNKQAHGKLLLLPGSSTTAGA
jgi:NADPH:quinone reductase-like Zn-dependent oxidoreductase